MDKFKFDLSEGSTIKTILIAAAIFAAVYVPLLPML